MADNTITLNMREHKELFWGGASISGGGQLFCEGGGVIFETNAEEMEINAALEYDEKKIKQTVSDTVLRGLSVSVSDDKGKSWRNCRIISSGTTHTGKYPIFRYASRSPVYVAVFFPMAAKVTDMNLQLSGNKEVYISPVKLTGRYLFIGGSATFGAGVPCTYDTLPNLVMQNTLAEVFNNGKNTENYTEYYMDGALMNLCPDVVIMECNILKSNNYRELRNLKKYIAHIRECSTDSHLILWIDPCSVSAQEEELNSRQSTINAVREAVAEDTKATIIETLTNDFTPEMPVSGKGKMNYNEKLISDIARKICDQIADFIGKGLVLQGLGKASLSYKSVSGIKDTKVVSEEINIDSPLASVPLIEEALIRFEVDARNIVLADTSAKIENVMKAIEERTDVGDPFIVYAPPGNYKLSNNLIVPENVILVAEKESIFEPLTSEAFSQLIVVHGNIYGGTYDCKDIVDYGLRFGADAFRRNNGIIERASVLRAKENGIIALGSETRFACMYDNTVSECGNAGISAEAGAWVAVASGNNCSENKGSGIRLQDSNINIINNNVLNGNGLCGISTETGDPTAESAVCQIHKMVNNEISGNGSDGVYIAENCCVDVSFARNDIRDNRGNGLKVGGNAYVNAMVKNRFSGNAEANIYASGEGSSVKISNSNVMQNADINLSVSEGGSIAINGENNRILTAVSHGILVSSGAVLHIGGEANRIAGNGGAGIMLTGNSAVKITNTVFRKNKKFAVRVEQGSSFDYDRSSNIGEEKDAENRVYYSLQ